MLIKRMEKKVNELIEESVHASAMGDYQTVSHTHMTHTTPCLIYLLYIRTYHVYIIRTCLKSVAVHT